MSFNLEYSIDTIFTISIVTVKHTHEKKRFDEHSKDVVIVLKFNNDTDSFEKI